MSNDVHDILLDVLGYLDWPQQLATRAASTEMNNVALQGTLRQRVFQVTQQYVVATHSAAGEGVTVVGLSLPQNGATQVDKELTLHLARVLEVVEGLANTIAADLKDFILSLIPTTSAKVLMVLVDAMDPLLPLWKCFESSAPFDAQGIEGDADELTSLGPFESVVAYLGLRLVHISTVTLAALQHMDNTTQEPSSAADDNDEAPSPPLADGCRVLGEFLAIQHGVVLLTAGNGKEEPAGAPHPLSTPFNATMYQQLLTQHCVSIQHLVWYQGTSPGAIDITTIAATLPLPKVGKALLHLVIHHRTAAHKAPVFVSTTPQHSDEAGFLPLLASVWLDALATGDVTVLQKSLAAAPLQHDVHVKVSLPACSLTFDDLLENTVLQFGHLTAAATDFGSRWKNQPVALDFHRVQMRGHCVAAGGSFYNMSSRIRGNGSVPPVKAMWFPQTCRGLAGWTSHHCLSQSLTHIHVSDAPAVEVIHQQAFIGASVLEVVDFSRNSSLKEIAAGAFQDCVTLKSIHLPSCLQTIGDGAFTNCTALQDFGPLPAGLTTLGKSVFDGCIQMTHVNLSYCIHLKRLVTFGTAVVHVTLPDTLEIIGERCFHRSNVLSVTTCPDLRRTLSTKARRGLCVLPSSLTFLHKQAFAGCPNITQIDLAACTKLTIMMRGCFSNCPALQKIAGYPPHLKLLSVGCFEDCATLQSMGPLPSTVAEIGSECFSGCSQLGDRDAVRRQLMDIHPSIKLGLRAL